MKKYASIEHLNSIKGFRHGSLGKEIQVYFIDDDGNFDNTENTFPVIVENIGLTYPDKKYYISRENKPRFIFEYVLDGVGHVINNGNYYKVQKGDVYVLEPGGKHHYYADSKNPYEKIWINFRSAEFEKYFETYQLKGVTHFKSVNCHDLFQELLHLENMSIYGKRIAYEATGILFRIMMRLVQSLRDENANIPNEVYEIKNLLDSAICSSITIEEICNKTFLSKSFIIKKFKHYFGMTPHHYLIEKKIKLASSLLKTSSLSIKEISVKLCFSDELYFSNVFKKNIGVSPKAFRQSKMS